MDMAGWVGGHGLAVMLRCVALRFADVAAMLCYSLLCYIPHVVMRAWVGGPVDMAG